MIRSAVALILLAASGGAAADSPRFGGPGGDFQFPASAELLWPEGGPKLLWKKALGEGWSGIAAVGPALYTMYRRDDRQEVVAALDAETGRTLWEHAWDEPLPRDFDRNNGTGPRATPLVVGDRVFAVGAAGKLHALNRATGKPIWSVDLPARFQGMIRANGYSASPVAFRDTVIVLPGGKGAAIAALKQSDGSVVWKKHDFTVSYATPALIRVSGAEQLIAQFSDEVTGLDPATGDLLWSHPHTNTEKVSVALPVWHDGLLFLSSAYDGGSRALRVHATQAEEVWTHRLVRIHHGNAVHIGGTVYAASGDLGAAPLAALELATGKLLWRDRTFPKASLLALGTQLLILDEDGVLALARPTPQGLEVLGKTQALQSNAWTPPTLVGKRVYLRDRHSVAAYLFE